MASVSSLDKDLRQMRLDKYTPKAANEVRAWIEDVLGERLASGDLLDALKDGVALCKLASLFLIARTPLIICIRMINLAVPPGVKYKQSAMPFVQMENISHFLRACQSPPLSLPPHDVFLTVDLYESKDPAQVLQCIGAFSRRANALKPSAFPRALGAKSKAGMMSPQFSGSSQTSGGAVFPPSRERGTSNVSYSTSPVWNPLAKGSYASGRTSPVKNGGATSPTGISSWSKREHEGNTAPAWNIHQYGYMGGASQGNQGIAFGARRQITSAAPSVPSLAEKERRRKEEVAEAERLRLQAEETEHKRRVEREAEEERQRAEEERRWEEETRRLREKERRDTEEEKRRWDAEQRRWKEEEDVRAREEKELEAQLQEGRARQRGLSDARLNGQFLSQYQANQEPQPRNTSSPFSAASAESDRIRQLERELELAKDRERQYERERQERVTAPRARSRSRPRQDPEHAADNRNRTRSRSRAAASRQGAPEEAWKEDERQQLQRDWRNQQQEQVPPLPARNAQPPPQPPRPTATDDEEHPPPVYVKKNNTGPSSRPLPNPSTYHTPTQPQPQTQPQHSGTSPFTSRTDRYLSSNPAPSTVTPTSHRPADYSTTTEVDLENQRRIASQSKTKAGGWASKSLLEREMERERERQREWEDSQKQTQAASRDADEGPGPGQTWNVNQYGYMGGDSQNRGGAGLGVGGARRQIIGPRPPP